MLSKVLGHDLNVKISTSIDLNYLTLGLYFLFNCV